MNVNSNTDIYVIQGYHIWQVEIGQELAHEVELENTQSMSHDFLIYLFDLISQPLLGIIQYL